MGKLLYRKTGALTREEKKAWIAQLKGVSLGSDAFFPFGDNIERAQRSGVEYIAQAGGSIRDDNVIETCDKYGIAWRLPVSGCSIINLKFSKNLDNFVKSC